MKKKPSKIHSHVQQKSATPFFQAKMDGQFFGGQSNIQTKVRVGKPNDKYEIEADQVADQVVNKSPQETTPYPKITPLVRDSSIAKMPEEDAQLKEEDIQQKEEEVKAIQESPKEEIQESPVEAFQSKEEEVQAMSDEDAQLQEEEVQEKAEEETVQNQEDEAQMMPEEEAQLQADDLQEKEEEAQTQMEEVQEKEEEEIAQSKEEETQMMSDEDTQLQEEKVQEKTEEETVQSKEAEAQMMSDKDTQLQKEEGQKDVIQNKEDENVQAKALFKGVASGLDQVLRNSKGKGSPLPEGIRTQMEESFGADFSEVRIHDGADAIAMTKRLKAQAFAHQKDIYFNIGKLDVNSKKGQQLLAHELTHTIQQGAVKIKLQEDQFEQKELNADVKTPESSTDTSINQSSETPSSEVEEQPKEATLPELLNMEEVTETTGEEKMAARPMSPEEDPNFQALKSRSEKTAQKQQVHPSPKSLADNAEHAAPSPDNERDSKAQTSQVKDMDQQKPKEFNAEAFKSLLLEEIKKILPKNEEEADDFKEDNDMDQVEAAAKGKVAEEKTAAAGDIATATTTEPDVGAVPDRQTVALEPPKAGKQPPSLSADTAMPPSRPDSEVSQPLEENAREVDDEMANNGVTEEQLAISNEPTFVSALGEKKSAQAHAASAPETFRQQEEGTLNTAQTDAEQVSQQTLTAIHSDRTGSLQQVGNQQQTSSNTHTSERDRIATEINAKYTATKTAVEEILTNLDSYVEREFKEANDLAREQFETYVETRMSIYKNNRYGSWYNPVGLVRRAGDALTGMPEEVNKYFVDGRELYIKSMDIALTRMAKHIASELNRAKDRIAQGKKEVDKYVKELPDNLKKFGRETAADIQDKFAELEDNVNSKQEELIDTIAQQYKESLAEVDARIEEMKAANRGLIDKALDAIKGVVETIKKLRQMIENLFAAIKSVIEVIIADPLGFMGDLFSGIGKGIDLFKANISKHLIGGLFKWLTGALGPMGITLPEDIFSLSGIFDLIMQVLGLGWDFIRKKAVKLLGEPAVAALEKGFEMFMLFKEKGITGIWEYLKDKFTDLKETVIEAIKTMIQTKVIEAGIKWLLSLLIPGAGFIKAIIAIKDLIVFFVESAMMLIPALTQAIKAAASRNFNNIAKAIENGLSLLIPLVINLFAKLIGISGLAEKVQKIIKKIRKRIDRAVNKLILKAKKWVRKVFRKGKKVAGKLKEKVFSWWKMKKGFKTQDGKSHKIYFKGSGQNSKLMVASNPKGLLQLLQERLSKEKDSKKKNALEKALSQKKALDKILRSTAKNQKKSNQDTDTRKLKTEIDEKLSEITSNLIIAGIEKADELPLSNITYSMNSGKSFKVSGNPITKLPGNTRGSKPRSKPKGWDRVRKMKERSRWVKLHLINHHLHGPGTKWNLTPGTKEVNSQMEKEVESNAKEAVKSNKIIFYDVQVFYHDDKNNSHFPREIDVTWGEMKKEKSNYKKINQKFRAFYQEIPEQALDNIPHLNKSSAARLKEAAPGIPWNEIVSIRRKNDNSKDTNDFKNANDLYNRMMKHFADKKKTREYLRLMMNARRDGKIILFYT